MSRMRFVSSAALFLVAFAPLAASAESGEAAAVLQYCGAPSSEHQGISQVTNKMERDLIYGDIILHFQPAEDGWQFLSGWRDHLPLTQRMTEDRMPCFREAMVAAKTEQPSQAPVSVDPTIRQQTTVPAEDTNTFGIPHLRMIILLAIIVAVLLFLPGGRRRASRQPRIESMRYQRKPSLTDHPSRSKPADRVDV